MAMKKSGLQFVNPYNFVSVDWSDIERKDIVERVGELTGVMSCKLYTRSPIAIPDTVSVKEDSDQHKTYSFMRTVDNKLMIPGSSLRGVLRSVYETASDSCFVTSDIKQIATRRSGMRQFGKAYLLSYTDNGWQLKKAERYLIIIDDDRYKPFRKPEFRDYVRWRDSDLRRHKYGEKIQFDPGEVYINKNGIEVGTVVKEISDEGTETGYLYLGEAAPKEAKASTNKHFESIFVEVRGEKPIPISDMQIDRLKEIYKQYNDPALNRCLTENHPNYYKGVIECIEAKKTIPVWYNVQHDNVSLASIGRIAYQKTMGDMLGVKRPCIERNSLCKACSLFGMAKDEGKVGSRVRVTDAVSCGDNTIIPEVTLKELSSPHISYTPFYLDVKDGAFPSYDTEGATLRGRKYYWHDLHRNYATSEKTKRNATMDLADGVKSENRNVFEFKIYFNNITQDELEELKWVITLGENNVNSNKCHKIGHGKPIGLGSVKITIEDITLRKFDIVNGTYRNIQASLNIENYKNIKEFDKVSCRELQVITDLLSVTGVSYPFIEDAVPNVNSTASHQWFRENWSGENSRIDQKWQIIDKAPKNKFRAYKIT